MADNRNRLMVHPCAFDTRPCDSYTCRRSFGVKKYWISNPFGAIHDTVFCEDCIKHLAQNLPAELTEGGAELAERIRADVTAELVAKHALDLQNAEERITNRVTAELATSFAQQERVTTIVEADEAEEAEADEDESDKPVYRCLECPAEFETSQQLSVHRRIHDAPATPKKSGGKPAAARKPRA